MSSLWLCRNILLLEGANFSLRPAVTGTRGGGQRGDACCACRQPANWLANLCCLFAWTVCSLLLLPLPHGSNEASEGALLLTMHGHCVLTGAEATSQQAAAQSRGRRLPERSVFSGLLQCVRGDSAAAQHPPAWWQEVMAHSRCCALQPLVTLPRSAQCVVLQHAVDCTLQMDFSGEGTNNSYAAALLYDRTALTHL
jgi:hypothetical protein